MFNKFNCNCCSFHERWVETEMHMHNRCRWCWFFPWTKFFLFLEKNNNIFCGDGGTVGGTILSFCKRRSERVTRVQFTKLKIRKRPKSLSWEHVFYTCFWYESISLDEKISFIFVHFHFRWFGGGGMKCRHFPPSSSSKTHQQYLPYALRTQNH